MNATAADQPARQHLQWWYRLKREGDTRVFNCGREVTRQHVEDLLYLRHGESPWAIWPFGENDPDLPSCPKHGGRSVAPDECETCAAFRSCPESPGHEPAPAEQLCPACGQPERKGWALHRCSTDDLVAEAARKKAAAEELGAS